MSDDCTNIGHMFELSSEAGAPVAARLSALVDELQTLTLPAATDDELLSLLRDLETEKRRLASVDHAVIAEVEQRGLAAGLACRGTADLLVQALRVEPREAKARVRAAADLGPRRQLTGAPLPPLFAAAAAASAQGVISRAHARVVTKTVDKLSAAVAAEHDTAVEAFLVAQAGQHSPRTLRVIARRLLDTLDPDGTLSTERDRHRRRDLSVRQRSDGSGQVSGQLDAVCTEALLTVLDTLARPTPAEDGEPDRRSAGQRRHDALRDGLLTLLRSDQLPACGGVAATILLTLGADQLASRQGLARTGHGALISVDEALTLAGDAQLQPVALDTLKQITRLRACPAPVHRSATPGDDRSRRRMQLPGMLGTGIMVRGPPRHRLQPHPADSRRRRHPALRPPPPRTSTPRLELPHDRRRPALGPATLDRSRPDTAPKPHPRPRPRIPRPCVPRSRALGSRGPTPASRGPCSHLIEHSPDQMRRWTNSTTTDPMCAVSFFSP